MNKQIKKMIKKLAWWLLKWTDKPRVMVDTRMKYRLDVSKFIPKDDKWHTVVVDSAFWVKISKSGKTYYDDTAVFVDGKDLLPKLLDIYKK